MRKKVLVLAAMMVLAGCQVPQQPAAPEAPFPPAGPVPRQSEQPPMPPIHSAGPLTKPGVETYMDAQEADLRSYLRGQGVLVSRRGNALAITVQSDRLFDHGDMSDWGDAFLRATVQVLAHYDHTLIEVNGYSDAGTNAQAAVAVSQKRAKQVADGFVRYGVAASRVTVNGLGATNLRIANAADPRNRRIEIRIIPNPK